MAIDIDAAKRHYESDGFVKLSGLLSSADLDELNERLAAYERDVAPTLPAVDIVWEKDALPDGSRRIRNLWRLHEYSEFFDRFSQRRDFLELAAALVNGDPVRMGVETFSKPALVGSIVPHHQDNAYFTLVPPDCFSLWIALDASTVENGCVWYARGSHLTPGLPHEPSGVLGNSMQASSVPGGLDEVPAELSPGDAIAHHCETIHRSEPNRSAKSRRGLVIVYKGAHCRHDVAAAARYAAIRDAMLASAAT